MSPIPQPNKCAHPTQEHILTFKDGNETAYRCLVCRAIVTSGEQDPRRVN